MTTNARMADERLERIAVAWFTRINGAPNRQQKRDFECWRSADPAHERAYRDVEAAWQDADLAGAAVALEEADKLSVYLKAIDKARTQRRRRRLAATTVLCATMLAGGWEWFMHPNLWQDWSADYVTAKGERRSVKLADGSVVVMDADTAIAEQFGDTERRLLLLRGTAAFNVSHAARPFVVAARDGEARVLGTRFAVSIDREAVGVALEQGSLQVAIPASGASEMLKPGEGVRYSDDRLGAVDAVQIDDVMAWRDGRLVFENARLGDVVARVARYFPGRVVMAASQLADKRVSGSLRLDDGGAALASLSDTFGFGITRMGNTLAIIHP